MLPNFFILNVLCICLLGFLTSFSDLKKGLIQNKIVFPAILLAILLNFLNGFYFLTFFANGFYAFLFGFILWTARLWSAGDAKLFLALALLFPLSFYPTSTFPSLTILLNSFVPAFIFLLAIVLLRTTTKQKFEALKEAFTPFVLASVAVYFFSFYWLLDLFFSFVPVTLDLFSTAILLFVVISFVEFFLPKKSLYFFAGLSVLFLIFRLDSVLNPNFLAFFISFWLGAIFLLFFILRLGFSCFGNAVKVEDLKPGMVLLETVFEREGKIEKKKPLLPSFVNIIYEIKEKPFVESGPKGLNEADLKLLKEKKSMAKVNFDGILVQETLPFAPIIFVGTILSFFTALFVVF